eukprot:TRINITY_DN5657_c1_g1_i1.p1 TRINITY_DN5657_c1_g1~~TRINITY_DN5657_c1_g1_i1.p1  ORF type:complete len:426 (+),score=201.26 TRINITY_DN5657_c1_g1_i1:80-1279(+)
MRPQALLLAALLPLALAASTELTGEASRIKDRFSKKTLKQVAVIGYLPTFNDVEEFSKVAAEFAGLNFYHVNNRQTLDALGMVGSSPVVAIHRPWAGSKKFKVTHRGSVSAPAFKDWLANEALPPGAFVPQSLTAAFDAAAQRQHKAVVRAYLASEIDDPEVKKPTDWDQPQKIADPNSECPSDWDDDEDGPWEPPQIPNPEYKGEWKPQRISTLVLDPDDEKPEDWDQPEQIPDPRAKAPDDWDEEEDGPFAPPDIPNPAYRGEWKQKKIPKPEAVSKLQKLLAPVAEKYGKKVYTMVQDVSTENVGSGTVPLKGAYDFTESDYAEGRAVVIEEPKYSAMKQAQVWLTYKYPGEGDLTKWVGEWSAKKLVDMDKQKRQQAKEARLKAQAKKDVKNAEL